MKRHIDNFDLSHVYDEYDKSEIDLEHLLKRIFLTNGRLPHHQRILCWFPRYLEHFVNFHETMMNQEDILPITWKYYIAIMAVSCYECEYLLKILEEQFLLYGGDVKWLTDGLKIVDKKLQMISELNEVMAFRPWILNSMHIEALTQSATKEKKLNWSIPEIVQGSVILASYHALCCLIFGSGIKDDIDTAVNFTQGGPCKYKGFVDSKS